MVNGSDQNKCQTTIPKLTCLDFSSLPGIVLIRIVYKEYALNKIMPGMRLFVFTD